MARKPEPGTKERRDLTRAVLESVQRSKRDPMNTRHVIPLEPSFGSLLKGVFGSSSYRFTGREFEDAISTVLDGCIDNL